MKNLDRHLLASILGVSATTILLAQAPVWAASTKITAVRLSPVDGGMNVLLETASGDRPEVFSLNRGNAYIADIVNAQLQIAEGNFRQNKPTAGIASVEVTQIDANSVRVTITGENSAPRGRIIQGGQGGIILSAATGGPDPNLSPIAMPQNNQQVAQTPYDNPAPSNEVLLPETDPSFNYPVSPNQSVQDPATFNNPPAFQGRAVAPPLGDIAVSNIVPVPAVINLGSNERIPRLVLRDAPVRDVLTLLARAAGLNVAYTTSTTSTTSNPQAANQATGGDGTISLDIENESVQDVFNYVLRMSGLEANRNGNTIFVGKNLPNYAKNNIIRTFRLNQVSAKTAAGYLATMGAEASIVVTTDVTNVSITNTGADAGDIEGVTTGFTSTNRTQTTTIQTLNYEAKSVSPVLRGLQVVVDERLNTLTVIGVPNLVELASSQLMQLDLRQRQVAVNVKVIDINLASQENFNSSFSFGINDTFIINDEGAATVNFGSLQPANSDTLSAAFPIGRPIAPNPISGDPFYNNNRQFTIPGIGFPGIDGGNANFLQPRAPVTSNPLTPGIRDYEPAQIELDDQGRLDLAASEAATADFGLFPNILYPRRFLAQLQAQVVSGTGKVLTDPTLVVQEGETANVRLVESIVQSIETTISRGDGTSNETTNANFEDVGLILGVQVERIDDNGFVTMQVNPVISAPADRVFYGGNGSFATQVVKREVKSGRIRLRDGQTLILSGIITERERETVRKWPILGDLPIVGSLFRNTDKNHQRAEVIVLVTPQIMDDSDRSNWGYKYNPSPEAIDMMRRGQPTQRR